MTEPELQVQISSVFEYNKKASVMNMNNLACPLVYYYDVENFHATIFKYTRALHVSATTSMVQPTTIHNRIGYTLIGLQGTCKYKKILQQSLTHWHTCKNNCIALSRVATSVAYKSNTRL